MLYYIANNAIINDNNELNEYRRFSMTNSPSTLQGYLLEDFRLFHLKDQTSRTYSFHHHDFLKIMIQKTDYPNVLYYLNVPLYT